MDFEIAHINLSTKTEQQKEEELQASLAEKKLIEADEGIAGCPWEDDKPVVDWHTDSYPFVCVTMLSDCTNMIGGETALRTGDGDIMKVRGPQMVIVLLLLHTKHHLSVFRGALWFFKGDILSTKHYEHSEQRNASLW